VPDLTRIKLDPKAMGGKPGIRGFRVTIGTIVGLLASGRTHLMDPNLLPRRCVFFMCR
jgi:uncharacterized protein (DUF433 family)